MSRAHSITLPTRRRSRGGRPSRAADAAVTIRAASPADAGDIARLSELDERALPQGEQLLGVLEGRVVAALDVDTGSAIADPFVPTVGVVKLLELRAKQVR
jgi:hypothetical protein